MKVVVVSEGQNDEYMLKPIVEAMMANLGKPNAAVRCHPNPKRRRGISHRQNALGVPGQEFAWLLSSRRQLLGENAWQKVEVWVLAGRQDWPSDWDWRQARSENDAKEVYYLPYAKQRGVQGLIGEGRQKLAQEAARRYSRIRQLCPEVADLERRVGEWIVATGR